MSPQEKYRASEKGKAALKAYYVKNRDKIRAKSKQWLIENRDKANERSRANYTKDKGKKHGFKHKYGISIEDYNKMLEEQNSVCKICSENNLNGKPLYVDHCHTTGKVRGLLCQKCNTGLGMFKDNETLLLKAGEYLKGQV